MTKIIPILFLSCSFFFSRAQYPGYVILNHSETFKKSFVQATNDIHSIQSDFNQEKSLTMLSEKINSNGKFWYQQENKLRMEYFQPFPYLLVLNGGKILVKEGEKLNKVSAGSNRIFQQVNRILIDCVSGGMLDNPDFQSRIWESSGSFLVELSPVAKNLKELYKNINIVIDKKNYTANTIEMDEVSGNKTTIRFKNKELNVPIPDSVFNIP